MTITSEPEGARVFVSDVEKGRTPLTIPFTWYGDYDIILRYEEKGYKTCKTHATIMPPVYEIPPFDLLSEIAPWRYRDHRYLHFTLAKETLPSDGELIKRAEVMRSRNLQPVRK